MKKLRLFSASALILSIPLTFTISCSEEPNNGSGGSGSQTYQPKYPLEQYPEADYFDEDSLKEYAKEFVKIKGLGYFEKYRAPYEEKKDINPFVITNEYFEYLEFQVAFDPYEGGTNAVFYFQELFDFAHQENNKGIGTDKPWDELTNKQRERLVDMNPFLYKFQVYWDQHH